MRLAGTAFQFTSAGLIGDTRQKDDWVFNASSNAKNVLANPLMQPLRVKSMAKARIKHSN